MFRILACFIAAIAASLALGTGSASADPPGDGHNEHCGHGSHPVCPPPPPECKNKFGHPTECPPLPPPVTNLYNVIVGGPGQDVLFGTFGQDAIFGLGGNDRLRAKAGDDLVFGGTGNDILRGGLGSDTLRGGNGHDLCIGNSSDRFIACERVVVLSLVP